MGILHAPGQTHRNFRQASMFLFCLASSSHLSKWNSVRAGTNFHKRPSWVWINIYTKGWPFQCLNRTENETEFFQLSSLYGETWPNFICGITSPVIWIRLLKMTSSNSSLYLSHGFFKDPSNKRSFQRSCIQLRTIHQLRINTCLLLITPILCPPLQRSKIYLHKECNKTLLSLS